MIFSTRMINSGELIKLTRLLQFGDSVLPIGTFAFSCGLESAIQLKLVRDTLTLKEYIKTSLEQAAHIDAVGLAHAYRALITNQYEEVLNIDREIINRKSNHKARLMTVKLGKKLAELASYIVESNVLNWWLEKIKSGQTVGSYPVTQALVMGLMGLNIETIIVTHQYGIASTILSAAQRLMKITHFDSQRILYEVSKNMPYYYQIAINTELHNMESYAPIIDILASVHMDAHVRLFIN